MIQVVAYTCITGSCGDQIDWLDVPGPVVEGVEFQRVVYTDRARATATHLEIRPLQVRYLDDPVKTARQHKALAHNFFPNADYTIWMDGCLRFRPGCDVRRFLQESLSPGYDIAAFQHPHRACIYQEALACIRLKKDSAAVITRQMAAYEPEIPPGSGMWETAAVIRRICDPVARFNNAWWKEIRDHSRRDQLSFPVALVRTGLACGFISGCRDKSAHFEYRPHLAVSSQRSIHGR